MIADDDEVKSGWQIDDFWDQYKCRVKVFQKPIQINGVPRPKGKYCLTIIISTSISTATTTTTTTTTIITSATTISTTTTMLFL